MKDFHTSVQVLFSQPGKQSELHATLQTLAVTSCTEPGCLSYLVIPSKMEDHVVVCETYDSIASFHAHLDAPHYVAACADLGELISSEIQI